ncbi:MAG: hypothetical protein NTV34_21045 [Proteobacteria bacterium]|nr:hypothetical protein [Pseudomonadota bacterium]
MKSLGPTNSEFSPVNAPAFQTLAPTKLKVGRWLLEETVSLAIWGAAQLQWEESIYSNAWISISSADEAPAFENHLQPLNWLIETVLRRLAPDVVTLSGCIPAAYTQEFEEVKVFLPAGPFRFSSHTNTVRINVHSWDSFLPAEPARQNLGWVKKRVERERKEEARSSQPRKQPLLIRILASLSPIRRAPRHEKMIHPLTRYRS